MNIVETIDLLLAEADLIRPYGLYLKSGDKPKFTYIGYPKYREAAHGTPLSLNDLEAFLSTFPGYLDPIRNHYSWEGEYKGHKVYASRMVDNLHVFFVRNHGKLPEPPAFDIIQEFQGDYRFLSNFWDSPAFYDGIRYPTAEHAYQAAKFLDPGYREVIRMAERPHDAKVLGQTQDYPLRPGWHEGLDILTMSEVVASKFQINDELMWKLQGTDKKLLVEGNKWHDQRWGNCHCGRPECEDKGKNQLGIILMAVRASFREG